jgi:hypothetical protein
LYDELATDLQDGKRYDDLEFTLLERAENGSVKSAVTKYYTGAWLIVDNGYLAWPSSLSCDKFITNLLNLLKTLPFAGLVRTSIEE